MARIPKYERQKGFPSGGGGGIPSANPPRGQDPFAKELGKATQTLGEINQTMATQKAKTNLVDAEMQAKRANDELAYWAQTADEPLGEVREDGFHFSEQAERQLEDKYKGIAQQWEGKVGDKQIKELIEQKKAEARATLRGNGYKRETAKMKVQAESAIEDELRRGNKENAMEVLENNRNLFSGTEFETTKQEIPERAEMSQAQKMIRSELNELNISELSTEEINKRATSLKEQISQTGEDAPYPNLNDDTRNSLKDSVNTHLDHVRDEVKRVKGIENDNFEAEMINQLSTGEYDPNSLIQQIDERAEVPNNNFSKKDAAQWKKKVRTRHEERVSESAKAKINSLRLELANDHENKLDLDELHSEAMDVLPDAPASQSDKFLSLMRNIRSEKSSRQSAIETNTSELERTLSGMAQKNELGKFFANREYNDEGHDITEKERAKELEDLREARGKGVWEKRPWYAGRPRFLFDVFTPSEEDEKEVMKELVKEKQEEWEEADKYYNRFVEMGQLWIEQNPDGDPEDLKKFLRDRITEIYAENDYAPIIQNLTDPVDVSVAEPTEEGKQNDNKFGTLKDDDPGGELRYKWEMIKRRIR